MDIAFGNGLVQIVNENAICGITDGSLLGLIFLDGHASDYSVSVEDGLSDHKLVLCMRNVLPQRNERQLHIYVWDFSRADDVSILDYLELSLCAFDRGMNVNSLWLQFKSILNYCLE